MSSSQSRVDAAATDRCDVAVLVPCTMRGRREAKLDADLALCAPGEERRRS